MDMNAEQTILTRLLPKTGQTISYIPKDDGDLELGWWRGRLNTNNKTRFIAKTIGGDDVVIDRATGLMWAADGSAMGCVNGGQVSLTNAILYAISLDFAGFTGWRVPNIRELFSLTDFSKDRPCIDEILFPNLVTGYYQTSTTQAGDTAYHWCIRTDSGMTYLNTKGTLQLLRCVRSG